MSNSRDVLEASDMYLLNVGLSKVLSKHEQEPNGGHINTTKKSGLYGNGSVLPPLLELGSKKVRHVP